MSLYIVMPEGTTVSDLKDVFDSAEEGPRLSAHRELNAATEEARRLARLSRKSYVVMKAYTVTYHKPGMPTEPKELK